MGRSSGAVVAVVLREGGREGDALQLGSCLEMALHYGIYIYIYIYRERERERERESLCVKYL
jgi:hypothetical protein